MQGRWLLLVQVSLASSWLRILTVGDSIDRNLLEDWCTLTGGDHCPAGVQRKGTNSRIFRPTNCTTMRTHPTPLSELFKTAPLSSWEISICDHRAENVTVGFLFNKRGVSPLPPWHDSHHLFGMGSYNASDPTKNVSDLFDHFLQPALPPLFAALGGPPHAISMNSFFWDLSRLLGPLDGLKICKSMTERQQWIGSWAKNASDLIDAFHAAVPTVRWMGWRMSHNVTYTVPLCRHEMITEMNNAVLQVIDSKPKMHWEPWLARDPWVNIRMRDSIHPGQGPNIAHMKTLISTIKRETLEEGIQTN
jgi:hypothetical protein